MMNNSWRIAIFIIVAVLLIAIVTLLIVLPLIKKKKKESYPERKLKPTLKSALVEYFAQLYPASKKSSWVNMSQNQLYNFYKGLLIYYLPMVDKSVVTDSKTQLSMRC
jgi:NADH:ubiquinone oxidoreductase subunit 3 (subunit A)